MDTGDSADDTRTTVGWRHISSDGISPPLIQLIPYLELKLEHPDLDPSGFGDRFFPDAVPYTLDDTQRVFYWRPALGPAADEPEAWKLACATTHELVGISSLPTDGPSLVTEGARGTTLVVDGTIAGDVTTSHAASYSAPALSLERLSNAEIVLTVNGTDYCVASGERRRFRLAEQRVHPVPGEGNPTTITPELVVRYSGRRELHHPARGAAYRLFPSFGLDLDVIPNPLPLPTTTGELDDAALATQLGVDLSQRPFPERVLWQAFAHTAFDRRTDATPQLARFDANHLVLRRGYE